VAPQTNELNPNCTLAICTGSSLCGASKSIGVSWTSYQLKVQLRANELHTISFVTTCSAPAYVALRNLVIPGSGSTAAPVTSTLIVPTTLPPELSTTTETELTTITETSTEISTLTIPPEVSTTTLTQVSTVTETQSLPSSSQPAPEPRDPFSIRYNWGYGGNDDCGDNAVILASAPNNPDFMILTRNNYDEIPINSANYSLTLTPLNGRKLCTFHGFDEFEHCDWEGVPQTVEMRETRDGLNLRCPHSDQWPVDPPYDGYGTSTVFLQIGSTCPHVIKQIGCSRYASCTVDAYSSTDPQPVSFVYPFNEWLRFKAVGTGWTKAFWTVSYGGSVAAQYTQRRGERINIAQNNELNNVGDVQVTVDCRNVREVQTTNNCQSPILLGKPGALDSQVIQPYSTASFDLDENERGAVFIALDGQYYCANNERTGVELCAYDMIVVGPLESLDTHIFQLKCPNGNPPPLEISGPSIPIEARGNGFNRFNIALQVGCEGDAPCNAFQAFADSDPSLTISTTYPFTTPTTRLGVKAFGADPTRHMYFATWLVTIPDQPTTILRQENGQWLIIDVPSDATFVSLYVDVSYDPAEPTDEPTDPDPNPNEPDPQPRYLSLGASNSCSSSATVVIGTPTDPEYFILQANTGVGFSGGITSADPRIIFESLSGRTICAVLDRNALDTCGIDNIVASNLADGDDVLIRCPDNGPPRPDADSTIVASIGTTNTSPNLAVQIGCEEGNYCLSSVRPGYGTYVELNYPIFPPRVRFRVRILGGAGNGQFFSYVEWMVGFSGRDQEKYYQPKGQWFVVVVPTGASSIEVSGNAVVSGDIPDGGPTSMPDDGPVT